MHLAVTIGLSKVHLMLLRVEHAVVTFLRYIYIVSKLNQIYMQGIFEKELKKRAHGAITGFHLQY